MDIIKHRIELIKLLPKNPVVAELGCAEGQFSLDICKWGVKKLYMVDAWQSMPQFPGDVSNNNDWHNANFNGAVERVKGYPIEMLIGTTVEGAKFVPDNTLDLLYIDACHSYECVTDDINAWFNKVKKGRIIAFHDYLSGEYGVNRAVNNFAEKHGFKVNLIEENNPVDAGAWFRV